jgi:hypothetical protein
MNNYVISLFKLSFEISLLKIKIKKEIEKKRE